MGVEWDIKELFSLDPTDRMLCENETNKDKKGEGNCGRVIHGANITSNWIKIENVSKSCPVLLLQIYFYFFINSYNITCFMLAIEVYTKLRLLKMCVRTEKNEEIFKGGETTS